MIESSMQHATFVIERTYPVSASTVFAAWADEKARVVWRDDPDFKSDAPNTNSTSAWEATSALAEWDPMGRRIAMTV
jgi:uncharacterized protein YndB with AHSA1/START domain